MSKNGCRNFARRGSGKSVENPVLKMGEHLGDLVESPSMIWVFPKIGVPPNYPLKNRVSIINHPFWGTPIFGNAHIKMVIYGKRMDSSSMTFVW